MKYDQSDPNSIEEFGKRLIRRTLRTTLGEKRIPARELDKMVSGTTRGNLGNLVEKYYFGIEPDDDGTPDFKVAGVELKTTPVKRNKNGTYVAKERLVLGMIDYIKEANRTFETSTFFIKNARLMIMSYLHDADVSVGDIKFLLAKLFEYERLPKEDRKIIREDWEKINKRIRNGEAHELSEGDTLYLAACTKSVSNSIRRAQLGAMRAKPRAFSYKSSYMTRLLKREFGTDEDIESFLTDVRLTEAKSFEEQVLDRFRQYYGSTIKEISKRLRLQLQEKHKDKYATLARAMLGVRKKRVEEFEAAGVTMKTIQLKANGTPKEAMSFPTFRYQEIIQEQWDGEEEEGEVRAGFQKQLESRFLFIVYRCKGTCAAQEERVFEKAFFWTMPSNDLQIARGVWEETVARIERGDAGTLPASSESKVAHVRPKAKNAKDTYETPQGEHETKKCFWLNTKYIKKVIEEN